MNRLKPYPWQNNEWEHFQKLIRRNHLPHAVMLTGLPGLGKEHFARVFSQSIYCQSPQADGYACGSCAACHQFHAETLTDFRCISPDDDSSSITVDQIRSTIGFLELSHEEGRKKIALVSPADWMNVNAANSLLKTLEEPSGDALILLIASQPDRLPVTIRSRCQVVHIEAPALDVAAAWLRGRGVEDPALALAIVGGAPLSAIQLIDDGGTESFLNLLEGVLLAVSGRASSHDVVSRWSSYNTETMLSWMVLVSEWFIRVSVGLMVPSLQNHKIYNSLVEQAHRSDSKSMMLRHDKLLSLKQRRGVSLNHELLLDHLQLLWSGKH